MTARKKTEKPLDEKMGDAADKVRALNVRFSSDVEEVSKKINELVDRYNLKDKPEMEELSRKLGDLFEKYGQSIKDKDFKEACQEMDSFIRDHPHASVTMAAMTGYIIGSLFGRD